MLRPAARLFNGQWDPVCGWFVRSPTYLWAVGPCLGGFEPPPAFPSVYQPTGRQHPVLRGFFPLRGGRPTPRLYQVFQATPKVSKAQWPIDTTAEASTYRLACHAREPHTTETTPPHRQDCKPIAGQQCEWSRTPPEQRHKRPPGRKKKPTCPTRQSGAGASSKQ